MYMQRWYLSDKLLVHGAQEYAALALDFVGQVKRLVVCWKQVFCGQINKSLFFIGKEDIAQLRRRSVSDMLSITGIGLDSTHLCQSLV